MIVIHILVSELRHERLLISDFLSSFDIHRKRITPPEWILTRDLQSVVLRSALFMIIIS